MLDFIQYNAFQLNIKSTPHFGFAARNRLECWSWIFLKQERDFVVANFLDPCEAVIRAFVDPVCLFI